MEVQIKKTVGFFCDRNILDIINIEYEEDMDSILFMLEEVKKGYFGIDVENADFLIFNFDYETDDVLNFPYNPILGEISESVVLLKKSEKPEKNEIKTSVENFYPYLSKYQKKVLASILNDKKVIFGEFIATIVSNNF